MIRPNNDDLGEIKTRKVRSKGSRSCWITSLLILSLTLPVSGISIGDSRAKSDSREMTPRMLKHQQVTQLRKSFSRLRVVAKRIRQGSIPQSRRLTHYATFPVGHSGHMHVEFPLPNKKKTSLGSFAQDRPYFYDVREKLPRPEIFVELNKCTPMWNSVALFFNLNDSSGTTDYKNTTVEDAANWLDEGVDPAVPGISEFMCRYWHTVSYGNFAFGINTPRSEDASGKLNPMIPSLTTSNPDDWTGLIKKHLDQTAEQSWEAAGSLLFDGKRWIPSVVLIQNYKVVASAHFGSIEHTVGGHTYHVGDRTHINYSIEKLSTVDARKRWGTLAHEYAHNFLEFYDLYGPPGATGYWCLLGDNSPPGTMSEISSIQKHRLGWLKFKYVIEGPTPSKPYSLKPYTTFGEAIKVIPDPINLPEEYFILEYRKSTGPETWRPDGGLPKGGLLITHVNERLGVPRNWILREAPFFDPEFSSDAVLGIVDWTGYKDLTITELFPSGAKNRFTKSTVPSSHFYGGKHTGLSVVNIKEQGDKISFNLSLFKNKLSKVGWEVGEGDRALPGFFSQASLIMGSEIFIRNHDNAALIEQRQAQYQTLIKKKDWIGQWNLGSADWEQVGDFDGDGLDEIFIRSPNWAGILEVHGTNLVTKTIQSAAIGDWSLEADNWEVVGDFDGDGLEELAIRSPDSLGLVGLTGTGFNLDSKQTSIVPMLTGHGVLDLSPNDKHLSGRFRSPTRDDLLVIGPDELSLLSYKNATNEFVMRKRHTDWIGGWNLGTEDNHYVGDFDGDGIDEIYIRSATWAGLLKWKNNQFKEIWMVQNQVPHANGSSDDAVSLDVGDKSYVGRFRTDREGILHQNQAGLYVFLWDKNSPGLYVDSRASGGHKITSGGAGAQWALSPSDKIVLADFDRLGPDISDAPKDYVTDNISDIFMHNTWGTGAVGYNPVCEGQNPGCVEPHKTEFSLVWIRQDNLLNNR